MERRTFLETSTLTAAAMVTSFAARTSRPGRSRKEGIEMTKSAAFWPNGARLVVSVSMQFEAGAQPERGAESPFPVIDSKYPDLPVASGTSQRYSNGSAPSVNGEFGTVNETGTIRRQKDNCLCYLVRCCWTTRRRLSG